MRDLAIRLAATLACGAADALGFVHAARVWQGGVFQGREALLCAESATGDRAVWRRFVRNILGLLEPGGLFITAALRRCRAYHVGRRRFACADIDEHDIAAVLHAAGVERRHLMLEVRRVGLRRRLGYGSIVLAAATLPPAPAPAQAAAPTPP